MFGIMKDWEIEAQPRICTLEDYKGAQARWCPGCGDHSVLATLQRLARDQQLPTEKTVVVSGIGCSSRLPHYFGSYGLHTLHGRPLPVACGIRSRRPDLHMFVVTGDGDCCAIGTGHWIHALRYNMDFTILMLDNNVYGLTKNQTSPTTRVGERSNTHPKGSYFPPLNPISVALSVANASFIAQTVDWNPPHVYATIKAAYEHKGASFVRILQRCTHFTSHVYADVVKDTSNLLFMEHPSGIEIEDSVLKKFTNRVTHDPHDLDEARRLADRTDAYPIGLFFRNEDAFRYDLVTSQGLGMTPAEKVAAMERALDKFAL